MMCFLRTEDFNETTLLFLLFSPDSAKDIKHKISFLLQKPEHQTAEPKQKEKSDAAAAATAAKRSETLFLLLHSVVPLKNTSGSLETGVKSMRCTRALMQEH